MRQVRKKHLLKQNHTSIAPGNSLDMISYAYFDRISYFESSFAPADCSAEDSCSVRARKLPSRASVEVRGLFFPSARSDPRDPL